MMELLFLLILPCIIGILIILHIRKNVVKRGENISPIPKLIGLIFDLFCFIPIANWILIVILIITYGLQLEENDWKLRDNKFNNKWLKQ